MKWRINGSLELLARHHDHARLLALRVSGAAAFADDAASGRAGASGASSTVLSMRVCRKPCASARSQRRCTSGGAMPVGGAASGRTGPGASESSASQRGLRPHCDAAESGFTGRRRRLGPRPRAIPPNGRGLRTKL
jgi:hypothetical protein